MASLCSPPLSSITTTHRNLHFTTTTTPLSPLSHFPLPTEHSSKLTSSSSSSALKWRTGVSFFPSLFKKKGKSIEEIKDELFDAIAPLDRGAAATPEDQERIEQIARELEAANKIVEPLKSNLLNGKWELIYTTSGSTLQIKRPKILRPNGKIYQAINADSLRAQNMETWPFFNQVTADLVPLNERKVAVKFDTFKIGGLIPIKAPDRARGELEITYLDEEIRIRLKLTVNCFDPKYLTKIPLSNVFFSARPLLPSSLLRLAFAARLSTDAHGPALHRRQGQTLPLPKKEETNGGDDNEEVEMFYTLLSNVRFMRDLMHKRPKKESCLRSRESLIWKPTFELEDFQERSNHVGSSHGHQQEEERKGSVKEEEEDLDLTLAL